MGRINRLDEHLSNMIAAGEVVERPQGIVKELIENCIDAHAENIEIQISQGGIGTITIVDDGDGMDPEDATLAFERHATSKLKEVNDLWNIHTMGFRGEALPSIASVSHVMMRTNDGTSSTEVEISYGKLVSARPCGTPKGTMIEIQNLFQKTPARFKHLKSPQYEFSLISDVVQKFALSHPDIGFCLSHDGRTVFKTKGSGNLLEVLMQIYGRDSAKSAIALDGSDHDYKIKGYIMQPQFNRATKYYMLLYINGRMIRNYHLQKAILDAYSPYMPKDRYPIVVIDLLMDAQLVDVNVHPSKWEIRLSKEKQLEKLLYETIQKALQEQLEVPRVNVSKETIKEKVEEQELQFTYERDENIKKLHEEVNDSFTHPEKLEKPSLDMEELRQKIEVDRGRRKTAPVPMQPMTKEILPEIQEATAVYDAQDSKTTTEPIEESGSEPQSDTETKVEPTQNEKIREALLPVETDKKTDASSEQAAFKDIPQTEELVYAKQVEEEYPQPLNPSLPQLRVIGQFHNCYILAEGEKGLYIIDQHAAQERYHYELIRKQILAGNNDTQPLLLPITIESTISAVLQAEELNALLEQIGIHLEVFGDHTFVCRQLPLWMKDVEEEAFLCDMIDIWEKDKEVSLDKLRKHAIATMACHSSIRFNRSLTLDEMKRVIDDLARCEQPFHCPHGRPTMICMEDKALIHEFERG